MKVLFVIPGSEESTSMIFVKRQVESLSRNGVAAHKFFLGSRTSLWELLKERRRFQGEVLGFKPDIIHAQYGTMTAFFSMFTKCNKFVITFRGTDLNFPLSENPIRSFLAKLLSYAAGLKADRVICVSNSLKNKLWWCSGKVTVIPNGVNTDLFAPMGREISRRRLGLSVTRKIILFDAGSYRRVKRLDLAKKSFELVKNRMEDVDLFVLDGSVHPEEMPWYLSAADCLLVTSDSEGSPNIVKEALACNLPIVSVDVGDIQERLSGVSFSKIVPRDCKLISEALIKVLMSGVSSNGRDKIFEVSESNVAKAIIREYGKLLEE